MEYITLYFWALVDLSNAMAPYILFGLFFAGVLHEMVPDTIVSKHLGRSSLASVMKATLFGVPLPVCSCGVIPLATSIKKSGASKGATLSFLISTPITGIDSILATFGMFGWVFTIYRVITSMIISIIAGVLSNIFDTKAEAKAAEKPQGMAFQTASATPATDASSVGGFTAVKTATPEAASSACESGDGSSCSCETQSSETKFSLTKAMRYAFVTLLGDIASPLLIGLLLGALITVSIPENLSQILIDYNWLSYLIVMAIAVPMYVCATASLPIAAGLILAGVSPGAAFVFLSAGPATNTVTIGVVKKMLGTRTLYIYLGTIIVGSMLFGLGLDALLSDVSIKDLVHLHEDAGWIAIASSLLLWALVLWLLIKPYFEKKPASCCSDGSCH